MSGLAGPALAGLHDVVVVFAAVSTATRARRGRRRDRCAGCRRPLGSGSGRCRGARRAGRRDDQDERGQRGQPDDRSGGRGSHAGPPVGHEPALRRSPPVLTNGTPGHVSTVSPGRTSGGRGVPRGDQVGVGGRGLQRTGEQEPLPEVGTQRVQALELILGLDALRGHRQAEGLRERDRRVDDGVAARISSSPDTNDRSILRVSSGNRWK